MSEPSNNNIENNNELNIGVSAKTESNDGASKENNAQSNTSTDTSTKDKKSDKKANYILTLKDKLIVWTAYIVAKLFRLTWTIEYKDDEQFNELLKSGKHIVISIYHGHGVPLSIVYTDCQYITISSFSKDGELATTLYQMLGFRVVRGSSSRGGERALINGIKMLRESSVDNGVLIFAVDGPRGPALSVKPGAIFSAKKTDGIVIPVVMSTDNYIGLKSWDRMTIPKPFAKINVAFGEALFLDKDLSTSEEDALKLQEKMRGLASVHCPYYLQLFD